MKTFVIAAAFALGVSSSALAHHSGAMFDSAKTSVVNGTVKEFTLTNPHSWIKLNVAGPGEQVQEFAIELGPITAMVRRGLTRTILKPGDKVQVSVHPLKTGAPGGSFVSLKLADGRELSGSGPTGPGAPE